MDPHRVQVLHIADRDRRIPGIADDLIFDLLIALDALFHQHLVHGRELKGIAADFGQFLLVVGKPAACSPQSKGRPKYDRVADFPCSFYRVLHIIGDPGGDHRFSKPFAELLESFAILRTLNTAALRSEQFDPAFPEDALSLKLHGEIQPGLPAYSGQDGIRPFKADDSGHVFQGQRLHIDFIRNCRICHDRGGIGVAEYDLVSLFFQRIACLRARVIKLRSLADHDGPRPDDHDFMKICPFRHSVPPPPSEPENARTDRYCPAVRARSPGETER